VIQEIEDYVSAQSPKRSEATFLIPVREGHKTDVAMIESTIEMIGASSRMLELWNAYRNKFEYASHIEWGTILASVGRAFLVIQ
jgi:hypothetical protein